MKLKITMIFIKKTLTSLVFVYVFTFLNSCDLTNNEDRCFESKKISFNFYNSSFNFKSEDFLAIDDLLLKHTYFLDSIKTGLFLPKEEIIIMNLEGKIAKQKTNNITYTRQIAKQLKKSNRYQIIDHHKLLAIGVLEIKRNDGKKIKICGSKNILAYINKLP